MKAVFSMVAVKECEDGYPLLTSVLHEVEYSDRRSGCFIPEKATLATNWIEGRMVLSVGLDTLEIRKIY